MDTRGEADAPQDAPRHTVAIVVDPAFGERLCTLSERCHVWAADTPENRAVTQEIWAASPGYSLERGVTIFTVSPHEDRAAWLLGILEDVELHHGWLSHAPPWSHVEVYGVALSDQVRESLAEYGFTGFRQEGEGFSAVRDPDDVKPDE